MTGNNSAEAFANSSSSDLIIDPAERELFKKRHLGLRLFEPERKRIPLPARSTGDIRALYLRSSSRSFSPARVPLQKLSEVLVSITAHAATQEIKFAYPSAGGSYSVQPYVYVRNSARCAVEGIAEGSYYYNPKEHCLYEIGSDRRLDRNAHALINRPVFDQSSLMICLAIDLSAIEPLYAGESLRMATIEAGMMAQALDLKGRSMGFGVCHIGTIDESAVGGAFLLSARHRLAHTMLLGLQRADGRS